MSRTPLALFVVPAVLAFGCTVVPERMNQDARVEHPDAWFPDIGRDAPHDDVWPVPDHTCASVRISTLRLVPRVMLIVDQSGSMLSYHFGVPTRWDALKDALVGADGLVTQHNHDAAFGLLTYTDGPDDPACPEVATQAVTFPGLANVRGLYDTQTPGGNTPTGESLAYVIDHRATLFDEASAGPTTGPEVMILATDGEPGTCADGGDTDTGRQLTVSEATRAFGMGIRTYVVSVGTMVANMHLQQVANAGVGSTGTDAPYWVATDATELSAALAEISSSVLPCTVELMGHIHPERACEGMVELGTMPLECGTDWHAVDETHITLSDSACARLNGTTDELVGTFPCDVIVF